MSGMIPGAGGAAGPAAIAGRHADSRKYRLPPGPGEDR